jgi:hypothetical protein
VEGEGPTLDPDGRRVAACFHHAPEEDRDVGDVAAGEDGVILPWNQQLKTLPLHPLSNPKYPTAFSRDTHPQDIERLVCKGAHGIDVESEFRGHSAVVLLMPSGDHQSKRP